MALFTVPIAAWTDGAIALLESATPCCRLPAQGPAWRSRMRRLLAKCLGECLGTLANPGTKGARAFSAALQTLRAQRRSRVMRVQRAALQSGRIYHLRGLRLPRGILRSGRWAESACWRDRTGLPLAGVTRATLKVCA